MRVALAQINSTLGDFSKNCQRILDYMDRARERRCDIIVFPEAALFGYHPMDLLERKSVVAEQEKYLRKIQNKVPANTLVVFGAIVKNPKKDGKPFINAAVVMQKNKTNKVFAKELLPTYDVFDEARHIEPGDLSKNFIRFKGQKILITICEDIWAWPIYSGKSNYPYNPIKKIKSKDVDFIVNLSASPFTPLKTKQRQKVVSETVKHLKAPMVYVNMVGAQDELIFDGGSFALDKSLRLMAKSVRFEEDLNVVDFAKKTGGERAQKLSPIESVHKALVLGLRDFVEKRVLKSSSRT